MAPAEIILKITLRGIRPPVCMERTFSENGVELSTLVDPGVTRFKYVYDFGGGWGHAVVIQKGGALDPDQQYPALIAGKRACPREDCGGVPGYYRLHEVVADPNDEQHAELAEWVGDDFDPERFDADTINAGFAAMARRRRPPGRRARRWRRAADQQRWDCTCNETRETNHGF